MIRAGDSKKKPPVIGTYESLINKIHLYADKFIILWKKNLEWKTLEGKTRKANGLCFQSAWLARTRWWEDLDRLNTKQICQGTPGRVESRVSYVNILWRGVFTWNNSSSTWKRFCNHFVPEKKELSFQFHKKKNSHLQVHIKNIAVQLTFVKNIFYSLLRNVLECFAIE